MEQPPGFVTQEESGLVCKVRRSLYGLKQSPRAWFSRFSSVVQEFGIIRSTTEHSVFCHHTSTGQCIYLIIYVDEIVITGSVTRMVFGNSNNTSSATFRQKTWGNSSIF